MGLEIEEIYAALGLLAQENILDAEAQAGVAFRRSLSRLTELPPEATKQLEKMGISPSKTWPGTTPNESGSSPSSRS